MIRVFLALDVPRVPEQLENEKISVRDDGGGKINQRKNAAYMPLNHNVIKMSKNSLDYLDQLEAEAIHILREVAGQFEKPALLFSGGKDSITLVRLAEKAFRPGKFPFPLVHIDTGHNFEETIIYRDKMIERIGEKLIVGYVQDSIDEGKVIEQKGKNASRNALQTVTLLDTIAKNGFDACIGGARRDEEKARAKERIFSVRDEFGQWDPKRQRPELWNIYNGKIHKGE